MLEDEVSALTTKSSSLLKSIGAAPKAETGQQQQRHGHQSSHGAGGKIKKRIGDLEDSIAKLQEHASLLETELLGESPSPAEQRGESDSEGGGLGLKKRIEAAASQVDDMRNRFASLESTSMPILDKIADFEDKFGRLGPEAERIFSSIGLDKGADMRMPKTYSTDALKLRLSKLDQYARDVQQAAADLGYQILGERSSPPSRSSPKDASIKELIASLGDLLQDCDSRISALANTGSSLVSDVTRLEDAVKPLSSRVAVLARSVDFKSQDRGFAPQGQASLKKRISALTAYINSMKHTTDALETELAGSSSSMSSRSQHEDSANTLKAKVSSMEMQMDSLENRVASLEQQV
jgi:chromosome segregation ATPase